MSKKKSNNFFEKIQYPALFGKTMLKNQNSIEKELDNLITEIQEKTDELQSYLCIEKV